MAASSSSKVLGEELKDAGNRLLMPPPSTSELLSLLDVSEMSMSMKNYGEELVGCVIKVWWPLDQRFYEGAISSFNPVEKMHKILYADGDEEVLDLSREHWMLVRKPSFSEQEKGNNLSNSSNEVVDCMYGPISLSSTEVDTNNPLWNYVTILEKRSRGGGNVSWQCKFCKVVKQGSYTRVKGHLLNLPYSGVRPCEKITRKDVQALQRFEDEAKKKVEKNKAIWNCVRKRRRDDRGGNVTWQCNFCKRGSYTRVRGHFLNLTSSGDSPGQKITSEEDVALIENADKGTNK